MYEVANVILDNKRHADSFKRPNLKLFLPFNLRSISYEVNDVDTFPIYVIIKSIMQTWWV